MKLSNGVKLATPSLQVWARGRVAPVLRRIIRLRRWFCRDFPAHQATSWPRTRPGTGEIA